MEPAGPGAKYAATRPEQGQKGHLLTVGLLGPAQNVWY